MMMIHDDAVHVDDDDDDDAVHVDDDDDGDDDDYDDDVCGLLLWRSS